MKVILRKFILFLAVGGTCTLIQYAILVALVAIRNWHATVASTVGFIVSALLNYALSYSITFKASKSHLAALPRFAFMAGTGLALNGAILQAGITYTSVPYLWVQVVATIVVLFWNFVGGLKWAFAPERPPRKKEKHEKTRTRRPLLQRRRGIARNHRAP